MFYTLLACHRWKCLPTEDELNLQASQYLIASKHGQHRYPEVTDSDDVTGNGSAVELLVSVELVTLLSAGLTDRNRKLCTQNVLHWV